MTIDRAFEADVATFGAWATRVPSDVLNPLVALDFDPPGSSKCPSHGRVSNRDAKVLFALLGHERLIEGLGLGGPRACKLIIFTLVSTAIPTLIAVVSFINALVIFIHILHVLLKVLAR